MQSSWIGKGVVLQVFVVSVTEKWTIPGARLGTKHPSVAAPLVCVSCLTKWNRNGGWSVSYGERKPLLTLCIFNINVIKAVSQTSLLGWREAGRAPGKKTGVCSGGSRQVSGLRWDEGVISGGKESNNLDQP